MGTPYRALLQKRSSDSDRPIQTAQHLAAALIRAGFMGRVDDLAQMARPSAHFDTGDDAPMAIGTSRLGGVPDLPGTLDWPWRGPLLTPQSEVPHRVPQRFTAAQRDFLTTDQPLGFVGQFNLADVARAVPDDLGLPQDGMLYLFYDMVWNGWGFDPMDAPGFRVVYSPITQALAPRQPPAPNPLVPEVQPIALRPVRGFDPMPAQMEYLAALGFGQDDGDAYNDALIGVEDAQIVLGATSPRGHKLRGWASPIQGAMEEECALVSAGLYLGEPAAYHGEEAKRILAQPNDWTLLWQIASEDDLEWGDYGSLYIWIRQSDLEQRNFDRVWLILQCS